MRLWHKDLIGVLPHQQLVAQWRECCAIAKNIAEDGTPNHLLVNKIMDYPINHFYTYAMMVADEMEQRNYNVDRERFKQWYIKIKGFRTKKILFTDDLFFDWHDHRYLKQCYYNLQEKYDCGGIPKDEWKAVKGRMMELEEEYRSTEKSISEI